jgi:hypothetical protein
VVFAPFNIDYVGIFDINTNSFASVSVYNIIDMDQKFAGAATVGTKVVFAPYSADVVGIFEACTNSFTSVPTGSLTMDYKFSGVAAVAKAVTVTTGGASTTTQVTLAPHNAVKINIPKIHDQSALCSKPLLTKGSLLRVIISADAIQNYTGGTITVDFTCLAEKRDEVPPVIEMTNPWSNQANVPASTTSFDFYFSEAIQAGTGIIRLVRPAPLGVLTFDVNSASAVSINGHKLSVMFPSGTLATSGLYTLTVPTGMVRDLERTVPGGEQSEGGGNSLTFGASKTEKSFPFTVLADTTGPRLN